MRFKLIGFPDVFNHTAGFEHHHEHEYSPKADPEDIRNNPLVIKAYLGEEIDA